MATGPNKEVLFEEQARPHTFSIENSCTNFLNYCYNGQHTDNFLLLLRIWTEHSRSIAFQQNDDVEDCVHVALPL